MQPKSLRREQLLPGLPHEVFPFFADAYNLERITPPILGFKVITPAPIKMAVGTLIEYRLRLRNVPIRWTTVIQAWDPPHRFVDEQIKGPYKLWRHTHEFEAVTGGTLMRDIVRYEVGFGPVGALADKLLVAKDLEAIFGFRAQAVARALICDSDADRARPRATER